MVVCVILKQKLQHIALPCYHRALESKVNERDGRPYGHSEFSKSSKFT
jgi:hypothetical protein